MRLRLLTSQALGQNPAIRQQHHVVDLLLTAKASRHADVPLQANWTKAERQAKCKVQREVDRELCSKTILLKPQTFTSVIVGERGFFGAVLVCFPKINGRAETGLVQMTLNKRFTICRLVVGSFVTSKHFNGRKLETAIHVSRSVVNTRLTPKIVGFLLVSVQNHPF